MKMAMHGKEFTVQNKQNEVLARFVSQADAELFMQAKLLCENSERAQQAYYAEAQALKPERLIQLLYALIEEAVEALRELPSRKSWAKNKAEPSQLSDNFFNELADIGLFLLAIAYWAGLSPSQFLSILLAKQQRNATRADHSRTDNVG